MPVRASFRLCRSRWMVGICLAGHLLGLTALMVSAVPAVLKALCSIAVLLALRAALRRPWPVRLSVAGKDRWEIIQSDGHRDRVGATGVSRVLPWVISVAFPGAPRRSLLLFPDAFCDRDQSALRALLRHGSVAA